MLIQICNVVDFVRIYSSTVYFLHHKFVVDMYFISNIHHLCYYFSLFSVLLVLLLSPILFFVLLRGKSYFFNSLRFIYFMCVVHCYYSDTP